MRAVVVTAAVTGVAALVFAQVAHAELARALQEKSHIAGTNADTRMLRWQAAARMLADSPVLGVGPGGFRQHYAAASHNAELDEQTPVAHNLFLEVAAELGLPGFLVLVAVIAVGFVAAERALRLGADRRPVVAVQAALIAVLVASVFLSEQYYLPLWSLVAVAVALEQRARDGRLVAVGERRAGRSPMPVAVVRNKRPEEV
ncbi:hypothetical protein BBK82_44560 [Lentzea guizhouensis]|uniref:O-antigen ligase-related domain-containing protein n=1 Tax=Lentzea guizhouensis TaxID=1586287 RepID=A0A1B2HW62_9PSEU|nr:hypothetical protein BBK82_44560 [Lentzea guizhouensis]